MSGYLKIGDIKGESNDATHKEWINLTTIANSISRPMASGASGATRHRSTVTYNDIHCTKEVDASTPKLQEAIADGKCFPKVQIALTTSSEAGKRVPYLMWELTNVRVSSYNINGNTETVDVPMESLALNFEEIRLTYDKFGKDNNSKGKIEYTWKLEEGTV